MRSDICEKLKYYIDLNIFEKDGKIIDNKVGLIQDLYDFVLLDLLEENENLSDNLTLKHSWVKHHQKSLENIFKERNELRDLIKQTYKNITKHGKYLTIKDTEEFLENNLVKKINKKT